MATEEPAFTLVVDEDAFQVRQYPPLVVAETRVAGDRKQASSDGFRILAGYIFGGNTPREKIAMTAPVMQSPPVSEKIAMTAPVSQTAVAGAWVIQFTMHLPTILHPTLHITLSITRCLSPTLDRDPITLPTAPWFMQVR